MAKDDYFVLVCKILCYLYSCLKSGKPVDLNYLSNQNKQFAVNDRYWNYILLTMAEGEYIRYVRAQPGDDYPEVTLTEDVEITPKGIEYLQESSVMKKAFSVIKEIKDLGFSIAGLI